ncbi:MAG: PLP-dependent transferase [Actinomycetota bacterium]
MSEQMPWNPATRVVASGRPQGAGAPLNTPIVPASTFGSDGTSPYARGERGTDTWEAFETFAGDLEQADAVSFASGMAACAAVFSLVTPGAHVVVPADCYQGVAAVAAEGAAAGRWTYDSVATDDTAAWVAAAASADLLWVETPSNPLLLVGDLVAIAAAPRPEGALLVVDNTFATPLNQRPLDVGADLSVQSATKFLGGHSDLLSGLVTTRSEALAAGLRRHRMLHGATPGALESYLALRGARTLAVRVERSQANAGELARRLQSHPGVERVRYPGLPDDPGHALATAQLDGFGSVFSFDLAGGAEAADKACATVRLIRHATSLGSVESTMERRAVIPGQEHLPPGLLRISVGIEDVEDLWADLDAAIATGD